MSTVKVVLYRICSKDKSNIKIRTHIHEKYMYKITASKRKFNNFTLGRFIRGHENFIILINLKLIFRLYQRLTLTQIYHCSLGNLDIDERAKKFTLTGRYRVTFIFVSLSALLAQTLTL